MNTKKLGIIIRNAIGMAKPSSISNLKLTCGIYFYRIEAAGVDGSKFVDIKKMILIK